MLTKYFKVRYLGPTNTKGSRVRITSMDGTVKTFGLDNRFGSAKDQAVVYLESIGHTVSGWFYDGNTAYILVDTL